MMKKRRNIQNESGYTIVELLIAIPLASIVLVVMMSALFSYYINVYAEAARSNLRTSGQALLINLQDELLFTIAYGEHLDVNLSDPYAPSGGWSYNSSPQTLIINEVALDSTRRDDDRHIVRRKVVSNCASASEASNPVALNNIIYFVEDNPGSDYDSLVKRTVTPNYNLCGIDSVTKLPCTPTSSTCKANAKTTTCPAANVNTGVCKGADSTLTDKVKGFSIKYFSENNIETSYPSDADKLEISLTLGDKIYGREVTVDVKHTIRKIN
ncbi:type II secretion system protein [Candidatus Saccharibacteria bacterium]|nr:type II secretion system protein [Candidatus Saccharibacteria bacterium]